MLTTSALSVSESKAIKVALLGDIAMRPGEGPALIGAVLTRLSMAPSTISRPGKAVGLEALCEARTRVVTPLGGLAMAGPLPPLQEASMKQVTTSRAGKSAFLLRSNFKRQAPNGMKDGDLDAK